MYKKQKSTVFIGDLLNNDLANNLLSSNEFTEEQEEKLSTSWKNIIDFVNKWDNNLLNVVDITTEVWKISKKIIEILESENIDICKNHVIELSKIIFNDSNILTDIMEDYLKYRKQFLWLIKVIITWQEYDCLTKLKNRHSLVETWNEFINEWKNFNVIIIDLNDFKIKNDTFWHAYWDIMLRIFSIYLSYFFNGNENVVFRSWWDEFIIYSTLDNIDSSIETFKAFLKNWIIIDWINSWYYNDLDNMINDYNIQEKKNIDIVNILKNFSFSYWYSNIIDLKQCDNFSVETKKQSHKVDNTYWLRYLITIADKRMYEAKRKSKSKNLIKVGLNSLMKKLIILFNFNKKQIS